MEGMQYIRHRVVDGEYRAILHWKVSEGVVYYLDKNKEWQATDVEVRFIEDFELATTPPKGKE